jgi:hypothetical protein
VLPLKSDCVIVRTRRGNSASHPEITVAILAHRPL